MDPLVQLVNLLRPQTLLWKRVEGAGGWGLAFPKSQDLIFGTVLGGECLLLRSRAKPVCLRAGDFLLLNKPPKFTLASDAQVEAEDAEAAFALSDDKHLQLGAGHDHPVKLAGGAFVFDAVNVELLTDFLPPLVHLRAADEAAWRVRTLLELSADETLASRPGGDLIIRHLMEILLIEILRRRPMPSDARPQGMLAGLADPPLAVTLRAMHRNVSYPWTVAELAKLAGMSRSVFALRFSETVGQAPIDYLLSWRMALAKDALRHGRHSLSEVAFAVGYQSASAFSTAFSRTVGCPPKRFAASLGYLGMTG
jgi:AraC-like DNA-binding protein